MAAPNPNLVVTWCGPGDDDGHPLVAHTDAQVVELLIASAFEYLATSAPDRTRRAARVPNSLEPGRRPVYLARVRDRARVPPLEVHARHEYAGEVG